MAEGKDNATRKMVAMRDRFKTGLGVRLRELEMALGGVTPDGDAGECRRSLGSLHVLSHKLRGAADTFGFAALSETAGQLEGLAKELLDASRLPGCDDRDTLLQLFSSLAAASAVESGVLITDTAAWERLITARETGSEASRTVLLVDDDASFVEVLQNQLTHFGFHVVALADPAELRGALAATPAAAVIMDVVFPGDIDAGVTTIKALRDEGVLSLPVVFLSARGDLPARLSAVRAGCDGYLVKPVVLVDLMGLLDRLTQQGGQETFRVVVVDDDPDIAELNAELLAQAGMETAVVTDPMTVMAPIRELRPDVILMDINMPGCDGFELAKVIRQDKAFMQTPIVFLTGDDIEDAWLQSVQSGGDEFLSKPIPAKKLLASVLAQARRSRDLSAVITRLSESEGRFRAVTESAREAIVTTDEKGRIVYWNGGARETFGYENAEVLGMPISMLMAEDLREAHERAFRRAASGKGAPIRARTIQTYGMGKGGGKFPVEISLADWRIGGHAYFTAIIRDTTERKRAEEERNAERQQLLSIFDSMDEAIYVADSETHELLYMNESVIKVWGRRIGEPCYRVFQNRTEPCPFCTNRLIFDEHLGTTHIWEFQNEVTGRWYRCIDRAIQWVDGRMVRFEMAIDITDHRRNEEKLTEYSAELERSNRELQDFANIVSHDLREPLRKVQAFGERLQAKYTESLDEQGHDYLRRMYGATVRMQGLIDDLLTFSRVTTRAQPFDLVDLNRVAREVVEDLETRIMDTGGRVEVADLPEIEADTVQMRQLLQNLISNGLKFHRQGAPPVVMVSGACADGNGKCRIVVEDNGIGIEKQYRERIFGVFKRLHTQDEYVGTGMGLAICKKIAKRHGGEITIESTQPGPGARFIVVLNRGSAE